MRSLARLIVIASVIAACNNAPSNPPSSAATGTPGPAPTAAGPGATSGPIATDLAPDAVAPTSLSKIVDALASGAIDEPTSLLYRMYAIVSDDRLPTEYRGVWSEDDAAGDRIREAWDTFSVDQRAGLLPFLLRPTGASSYWMATATASSQRGVQLASVRLAASACVDGFLRKQVSPTIPVLIWGQCGGMSEAAVGALVDEVRQDMVDLWGPMTAYMGEPIGDQNDPGDELPDSPEGGDGMLDIYLVDASTTLHGRDLETDALAETPSWSPWIGGSGTEATSTYIVVDPLGSTGVALRSTIAHEFFHSLQAAHNRLGMRNYAGGSTLFWFLEASAVWAEHTFVPEANGAKDGPYERFTKTFQTAYDSLTATDGNNEYASWAWPLFMQQELGRNAVANAWTGFEGLSGYEQLTPVLDGMLSFETRFRDFSVRAWNEDLEPGDPVAPRFKLVDGSFPTTQPRGARTAGTATLGAGQTLSYNKSVPALASYYAVLAPASGVGSLTFDFSAMLAQPGFDVDLILYVNGNWERRQSDLSGAEKVCDAAYAIVVVSNHDTAHNGLSSGPWTVAGDANKCNAVGSYSVVLTGGKTGAGTWAGTGEVFCSAVAVGDRIYWTAIGVYPTAAFGTLTDFNLAQNPDGFDSVSATAGGMETGHWQADARAGATAHVAGSGVPGTNGHVSGDGSWTDSEGNIFTIHIAADCSDTSYSP